MNKSVRVKQNWGLMPYANMVSSVTPASLLRGSRETFGSFPGERNFNRFPGWLGKNSTHGKNRRLLQEIHAHATSAGGADGFKADGAALREGYLPLLKMLITAPMRSAVMGGKEKEGIAEVMEVMNAYSLTRGDWESVQDICKFKGAGPLFADPSAGIPTAVKTAFTKQCNSGSRVVHSGILVQEAKKGRKRGAGGAGGIEEEDYASGGEGDESDDEDGPKKPKISAKRLAAIGFVAKEDPKAKKKKPAAKKKK